MSDMSTTTNRPFLSNFLAAFRAQSAFQKAATSPATPGNPSSSSAQSYSAAAPSATAANPSAPPYDNAAPYTSKPANTGATTAAVRDATATTNAQTPFSPTRSHPANAPYSKSPGSPNGPASPSSPAGFPIPGSSASRHRRGSDSSSDGGFRERTGSGGSGTGVEKWYIGGRTPGGEERFYKLGMVRRMRSSDRLSLDRLSL